MKLKDVHPDVLKFISGANKNGPYCHRLIYVGDGSAMMSDLYNFSGEENVTEIRDEVKEERYESGRVGTYGSLFVDTTIYDATTKIELDITICDGSIVDMYGLIK